jgi:hypothetical protein
VVTGNTLKMFMSPFRHVKSRGAPDASVRLFCLPEKAKSLGNEIQFLIAANLVVSVSCPTVVFRREDVEEGVAIVPEEATATEGHQTSKSPDFSSL